MTIDGFRRLALALPEAYESMHVGHPDFRVGKRVFATLGYPGSAWGMVKLTPRQQSSVIESHPTIFIPVAGKWGINGATNVRLRSATRAALWPALLEAWRNVAAQALVRSFDNPSLPAIRRTDRADRTG